MQFKQVGRYPGDGIPTTDAYCFCKRTATNDGDNPRYPIYKFRNHPKSNGNNGGWVINYAEKTPFNLELIF